ncbi:MAG: hypothetical protein ACTHK8_08750 [Ginsengibacter sp.]
MKYSLMVLIAIVVGFTACKKDNIRVNETPEDYNNKIALAKSGTALPTPENPLNAFDSVGYWHNRIVAYVQDCKPVTDTPDVAASTACVLRFYREVWGLELPASLFKTVSQTVDKSNTDIVNLIADCPYDEPVKAVLDSLVQLVKQLSDSNSPYPVIKSTIVDFENGIMQNDRLTPDGRAIALKAASVARYSIYYWINTLQPPVSSAPFKFKNIVKWIAAVTSDIGGAIVSGSVEYAADCSSYAYDLVTYSMP